MNVILNPPLTMAINGESVAGDNGCDGDNESLTVGFGFPGVFMTRGCRWNLGPEHVRLPLKMIRVGQLILAGGFKQPFGPSFQVASAVCLEIGSELGHDTSSKATHFTS